MARISDRARHLVREKLAAATESVRAERASGPQHGMDFERTLRILDQCSAAIEATDDIDRIADDLRATERAIEHYCSSPTKACVATAIHLIDKAIGGETF